MVVNFLTLAHRLALNLFFYFLFLFLEFSMFYRGDLSVKGETGSVKGETISANFWQGKVQIFRPF